MNAFRPPQDNFFWAREEIDPHNFTEILLARGEASGLEGESKNRNICIQYCISLRNGKHPPPPLPRHKLRHLSPPALSALNLWRRGGGGGFPFCKDIWGKLIPGTIVLHKYTDFLLVRVEAGEGSGKHVQTVTLFFVRRVVGWSRSRRTWMRWRCLWRPRQRSTRASVTVIPTWTGNKSPSPSPPPSTGGGREPARYP